MQLVLVVRRMTTSRKQFQGYNFTYTACNACRFLWLGKYFHSFIFLRTQATKH